MPTRPVPRLRAGTARDLALLVRHRRQMWEAIGGFSRAQLDASEPVYRRWVRRMMREGRFRAWIAEDPSGSPTGSGAVWLTEAQPRPGEPEPYRPYILSMFTEPAHRGEGIASAIVRAALEFARRRRFGRITLHAAPMGRSVYSGLGFERGWEMRLRLVRAPRPRRRPAKPARAPKTPRAR